MTTESDHQDAGIVVPGDESAQDTTDGATQALDLDTLDDLTDDEAAEAAEVAEVATAAARAPAST